MAKVKDMTKGTPIKLIVTFALPMLLGNAFQQLYSLVDTAVVGKVLGTAALAAVGSAGWLDWLVLGCMLGMTNGFSIVISQCFGAGDHSELRRAISMSAILTAITIIVLTTASLLLCRPVLTLMNTPGEALPLAVTYSSTLFKGLCINMTYNLFAAILRALGNSRTPLYAMIVASFVNVVLDIVFVAYFNWGVAGAAGATVCGQACAALICLASLAKIDFIRPKKADWNLHGPTLRRLLTLGTPIAGQNVVVSIGGLVLQSIANGFGMAFVAGYAAAAKICGMLEMAGWSVGSAMATYSGQNLGAKKYDRIRTGVRHAIVVAVIMALICGAVGIIFGESLTMLFVSEDAESLDEVIYSSVLYLRTYGASLFTLYSLFVLRQTLQGMGDAFFPIASAVLQVAIRIGLGHVGSWMLGGFGVYIADCAAFIGAAIMLYFAYRAKINKLDPSGRTVLI